MIQFTSQCLRLSLPFLFFLIFLFILEFLFCIITLVLVKICMYMCRVESEREKERTNWKRKLHFNKFFRGFLPMLVWESLPWGSNLVFFLLYGEVVRLNLVKFNKYAWCICYWSGIILCVVYAYISNKWSLSSKKSHLKFHFKHYILSHWHF